MKNKCRKKRYIRPQFNVVAMEAECMLNKSLYPGPVNKEGWTGEQGIIGGSGFVGPESGMAPAKENSFFDEDEE